MAIRHPKGDLSPSLTDTILIDNTAPGSLFSGATVKLQARAFGSTTLEIDSAAVFVDSAAGTVRYDWAAGDVDTETDYVAWWLVTLASTKTQRTPEFLLQITPPLGRATTLCEVADVRERLQIRNDDRDQDALIEQMIQRASAAIEHYCDREFTPTTAATRRFHVNGCDLDLAPYDLRTVTTMTLHPESTELVLTAGTDYELGPIPARYGVYTKVRLYHGLPLATTYSARFGHALIDITGNWGFATVPADVREAAADQAATWMRAKIQAYSVAYNPDETLFERPEAITTSVRRMLDPYRRWSL